MSNINTNKQKYVQRINQAIDFIKANADKNLQLEDIAAAAHFSKFYFHRIFKAFTGETLNEFVMRSRIERCAHALINNRSTPITSIALDYGFSSSAVFSRAFKIHFDCSPSEWREKAKESKICITDSKPGKARVKPHTYIETLSHHKFWRVKMNDTDQYINIEVKKLEPCTVAYVRHHGAYKPDDKALFQGLFSKLMAWAIPNDVFHPPKTQALTVFSSGMPGITEPEKLSVDVCIGIDKDLAVKGEVGKRELSGGLYAILHMNEATMEECQDAWAILFSDWLPQSGYQPDDRSYFLNHLNNPEEHPKGLNTIDMCLPVKPL